MQPTQLLNDDGTASMATMILLSHHAFRRDLARLQAGLAGPHSVAIEALRGAWDWFAMALHGHHEREDADIFPHIEQSNATLAQTLAQLSAQHHQIGPILERGKQAFAALPSKAPEAAQAVADIAALLDTHLDLEEATVIPELRNARQFPAPANDAEAELFASGFAWSLDGIAPDVVERVMEMLPEALLSRLPEARRKFEADRDRNWGPAGRPGLSRTSIPAPR